MTHPGDLLSALLDGELDAEQAAELRAHVETCQACELELDTVRQARRLVRELPAVEPPTVLVLPSARPRYAAANVAASIAAGLLLLAMAANGIGPAALRPEVAGAVDRHASTISALQAGGLMQWSDERLMPDHHVPPTTAPRRDADAPRRVGGYELVDAFRSPGGLHLLYRDGRHGLSVFEQPGSVDWDALPAGGTRIDVAGHAAWRWDAPPARGRLVVVDADGMVITVVGDEFGDAVLDVAAEMPRAPSASAPQKLRRAIARALDLLSPAP